MGLISHAITGGIGYYLARPAGQRQLVQLRRRAVELAHSPRVTQLPERGRALVGDRALTARTAVRNWRAPGDPAPADPALDESAVDESAVDESAGGGSRVVDASAPLRGRRLRRQRIRESGRLRPAPAIPTGPNIPAPPAAESTAATGSPTPTPDR